MTNISLGKYGEELAIKYLEDKGFKILDKNFRTSIGEIDIIAFKSNIISFIEVKTRNNLKYGYPFESVNKGKQRKIINVSMIYLKKFKLDNYQMKYDIIDIILEPDINLTHYENAFY